MAGMYRSAGSAGHGSRPAGPGESLGPRPTPAPGPAGSAPAPLGTQTVVLLLADIAPAWRAWGWWRIARGGQGFKGIPGLCFARALGTGHEGGFGLRPSASRQGFFLVFDDEAAADAFLAPHAVLQRFQTRSREWCVLKLQAWSARGQWSGQGLGCATVVPTAGLPVAALTRASVRPGRAAAFWRHTPASQAAVAQAPGCRLAVGMGEAPLLRQATFSLWDNVAAMDAYARSGAHLQALRASAREGYFSESMFVRFTPLLMQGRWKGLPLG